KHVRRSHPTRAIAHHKVPRSGPTRMLRPDPNLAVAPRERVGVVAVGDELDQPANDVTPHRFRSVHTERTTGVVDVPFAGSPRGHDRAPPSTPSGRAETSRSRMVIVS